MEVPSWAIAVLFPVSWCLISWLIANIGGWSRWAKAYPNEQNCQGKTLFMQSGAFSLGHYKGTLNLSAEPTGLALSVIFLFRFGHHPILIPWSELKVSIKKSRWTGDIATLSTEKVPGVRLQVSARTWEKLQTMAGDTAPLPEDNRL